MNMSWVEDRVTYGIGGNKAALASLGFRGLAETEPASLAKDTRILERVN